MITTQWILTYKSSIWEPAYIKLKNSDIGISGVGDLERATIFNEDMKKDFGDKVMYACRKNGFDDPIWQEVRVYIGV